MKIVIDEDVCKKSNLKFEEVVGLLLVKSSHNAYDIIANLEKSGKIKTLDPDGLDSEVCITDRWNDVLSSILLNSDDTVPNEEELEELVMQMRELFPKGIKVGSSVWRGNKREITRRLQTFFKLYGNLYTKEQILDATKRYVQSFNGDYTKMRILKYFILKNELIRDENGKGHYEDISDLANFLENDNVVQNNDDWLIELR